MKKLLLICMANIVVLTCFSQFEKGEMLLGGTLCIGADGSKQVNGPDELKGPKDFEFKIVPNFYYFLNERLNVGGGVGYSYNATTTYQFDLDGEQVGIKDRSSGPGIFAGANYFLGVGEKKKAGFYGGVQVGFWSGRSTEESYNPITDEIIKSDPFKYNSFSVSAFPGIFYRPTDCLVFQLGLGGFGLNYNHYTDKYPNDTKETNSYFKLGGNTNEIWKMRGTTVGVSYIFGGNNN